MAKRHIVFKTQRHVIVESDENPKLPFEVFINIGNAKHFVSRHPTRENAQSKVESLERTGKGSKPSQQANNGMKRVVRRKLSGINGNGYTQDQAYVTKAARQASAPELTWEVEIMPGKVGRFIVVGYQLESCSVAA